MKSLIYLLLGTILIISCKKDLAPISGCTDNIAINYNPNAINDDGSCIYFSTSPFIFETPSGFPTMNIQMNGITDVFSVTVDK